MKKFLFIITLLISALGLNAQSVGDETAINCGSYYLKFSITSEEPAECMLFGYAGAPVDVTIPSMVTFSGKEFAVTSIGWKAFSDCSSLTSIEIPSGVTSIVNDAFNWCESLTSIEFGENSQLTSIGDGAFYDCSSLTSIEIPSGVISIGDLAFYGCSSLTSIEIPSGVTSIGYNVFYGCSSLTSIEIPNSVTSIVDEAFYGCSSLTSIEMPSGVTSIGGSAFSDCSSLTSIEIPSGVTSIGEKAFHRCSSLTSIIVESGNTVYDSRDNCNAIIETATNTLIAGCQNTVIPNTVSFIGNFAFSNCYSLTSIEIPSGVISIGDFAFSYCSSLTSIEFGENSQLTSIGEDAFSVCSSLTSIEIPSGITSIGSSVFFGCSSLTSIEIPSGVTSIGGSAFSGCSSLTSIEIPSGVTSIGIFAFAYSHSLTSIELPSSVTSIGKNAFEECLSLTKIYCYAENVPQTSSDALNACPSDMVIYVPAQSVDAYKVASPWNNYTIMPLTDNEDPENPEGDEPENPEEPEQPGDEPEEPIELDAPQNIVATAISTSSIIITWDNTENAQNYNVYRNEELITSTSNPHYTDTDLEYDTYYCYTITATYADTESAKSEEVCIKTLGEGVEELISSFNIYPNPVSDKLYIETQTLTLTVEIYDVYGKQKSMVNGQQSTVIDVTSLNSGIYFVMIKTNEGVVTKRFIKN